jgi:hypothetical protein
MRRRGRREVFVGSMGRETGTVAQPRKVEWLQGTATLLL